MLEVESQDSQESQRNATGFMFLEVSLAYILIVAVLGGQNLIFSRLILVVREGDSWDLGIFVSDEIEGRSNQFSEKLSS